LDSHCCSSVQFSPLLQAVPGPHAEGYCQWLSRAGKAVGGKNTSLCAVKDLKILGCYKGLSLTLSFCAESQVSFCCHMHQHMACTNASPMTHLKDWPLVMQWTIVPAGITVHPCSRALVHVQHVHMHTLGLVCDPHVVQCYKNTNNI